MNTGTISGRVCFISVNIYIIGILFALSLSHICLRSAILILKRVGRIGSAILITLLLTAANVIVVLDASYTPLGVWIVVLTSAGIGGRKDEVTAKEVLKGGAAT